MKALKLSLIAALTMGSLLTVATTASAQTEPAKKAVKSVSRAADRADKLATELKLTDEQKTKLQALFEDFDKKQKEIRSDVSLTHDQTREKHKALQLDQDKKLKEILTPEQYTTYQANLAKQIKRHAPVASTNAPAASK